MRWSLKGSRQPFKLIKHFKREKIPPRQLSHAIPGQDARRLEATRDTNFRRGGDDFLDYQTLSESSPCRGCRGYASAKCLAPRLAAATGGQTRAVRGGSLVPVLSVDGKKFRLGDIAGEG